MPATSHGDNDDSVTTKPSTSASLDAEMDPNHIEDGLTTVIQNRQQDFIEVVSRAKRLRSEPRPQ